jgi:holliday junction DNA helicase RuvA
MIAMLSGEVVEKLVDQVVLNVNGIGYELYISPSEYDQLQPKEKYTLYVHEHIKEDAYDLYGFVSRDSKKLFELLISVKNVGPKVGLAILSIGPPNKIKSAIAGGDVPMLMSAKGVGKRAAEQLVVELRDKVGLITSTDADDVVYRSGINPADEALQALLALGYSEQDAALALRSVDPKLATDERVKLALKGNK